MAINVYKRKPVLPVLVKAILWDGTDECYEDIKELLEGKHIERTPGDTILFYTGENKLHDIFALVGEYIVYAMNEVTVYEATKFLEKFELFIKED